MLRLIVALAVIACAAHLARGQVIVNNFGTGDTFNTASGATVSLFFNVGVRVIPDTAATTTDVYVAMKSTGTPNIVLSICADTNGHPGAAITSTTIVVSADAPQVFHATFATPPSLAAGTTYWLKAVPGTGGGTATWMFNSTGQVGYASTTATGSWVASNGATPAFRVEDNSAPPLTGACCSGSTCVVTPLTACNAANTRFAGAGTSCNAAGNNTTPCCKTDFNQSGAVSVQDIFDFLAAWFGGSGEADFNGGGLGVQDLFDFLAGWFGGC